MSKSTLVGILIAGVILIVAIIWFVAGRREGYQVSQTPSPYEPPALASPIATATPQATQSATPSAQKSEVQVTKSAFTPNVIEIKVGGTVTWVNNDTLANQVASTPHPIHTDYPPLNTIGVLQPGQSKSLKFDKAGTYRYHNHLNPGTQGTVVVK